MIRIAIVEDEISQFRLLENHLRTYGSEKQLSLSIQHFPQAISLIEDYKADFDIIFMDIQLPYMNGMDAARSIRELDTEVIIIFITNLSQYAIHGYEVEALHYIVKPIEYHDFALKMSRAIRLLNDQPKDSILVQTVNAIMKLSLKDIRYIETSGHHVIYHTANKEYRQYATLSSVEKKLCDYNFFRCNNCYLVNLEYVEKIQGYTVIVDGIELKISQPRKKIFVNKLTEYVKGKYL